MKDTASLLIIYNLFFFFGLDHTQRCSGVTPGHCIQELLSVILVNDLDGFCIVYFLNSTVLLPLFISCEIRGNSAKVLCVQGHCLHRRQLSGQAWPILGCQPACYPPFLLSGVLEAAAAFSACWIFKGYGKMNIKGSFFIVSWPPYQQAWGREQGSFPSGGLGIFFFFLGHT